MNPKAIEIAKKIAKKSKSKLTFVRDPHEAVKGAHVIYTDTWTSMGQEEETAKRELVFPPYQVNAKLVAEADKDVIVMHCLPAHRNHELTDEVGQSRNIRSNLPVSDPDYHLLNSTNHLRLLKPPAVYAIH